MVTYWKIGFTFFRDPVVVFVRLEKCLFFFLTEIDFGFDVCDLYGHELHPDALVRVLEVFPEFTLSE